MSVRYPKPPLLQALPHDRHAVIEASAGTGKTFTLEHLVADLIVEGRATLEQILVVTFTEKAAGELRVRVRGLLEKLLVATEPAEPPELAWTIDDAARRRIADALRAFDAASICTIHSFCRKVLREHAFANRRLFREELADAETLFTSAFNDVLRRHAATGGFRRWLELWSEQGHSVEDLLGAVRSCSKLRGRLVPAFDPAAIDAAFAALPLGESAIAACEQVPRTGEKVKVAVRCMLEAREAWKATTGHSADVRYDALLPLTRPHPNLPKSTAFPLEYAGKYLGKALESGVTAVSSLHAAVEALAAAIPDVEPMVVSTFLPLVAAELTRQKRERGLFDFDDMLRLVDESLGAEGSTLLEALRRRFSYALIDEFQDTDELQWRIFRRIFFEGGPGRVVYLIGDPKQAIYRFRGADVDTYLAAAAEVLGEREPLFLEKNFRSTDALIRAYNTILDQQATPPFFTGRIRYDHPVSCGKPAFQLKDPDFAEPVRVYVTNHGSAAAGKVLPDLGKAMAAEIRRLVSPESGVLLQQKESERPLGYRDVFVLAATRSELDRVADELRAAGVPFAFYKKGGLFQSEEALQLEEVLEAVADPADRAKCFRAWLTPFFGLRLADLAHAGEVPPDDPLNARLRRWHELAEARDHERLFRALQEESGLVRRLVVFGQGERALTNFQHLIELLRQQHASRGATVAEMARALRSYRQEAALPAGEDVDLQRLETERDAVQLLTMHMSKGLEAPVVFVAGGFSKGQAGGLKARPLHLPSGERALLLGSAPEVFAEAAAREDSLEEQRLIYVALTRAQARLYLPFLGTMEDGTLAPASPKGAWRHANTRLGALLGSAQARSSLAGLFNVEELGQGAAAARSKTKRQDIVALPDLSLPDGRSWGPVRERHAGFITTSFSGLQRRQHAVEEAPEDVRAETHDRAQPSPHELPGGTLTGSFLHEILAALDPKAVLASATAKELGERPEVARLVSPLARRFAIDPKHLPHALELVHAALRAPLDLGGRRLEGIASADRLLREMEFLFPIPESSHPRLGDPLDSEGRRLFSVERGFVLGFIDLIFEHQGRVWFGDWKSNCLPGFDRDSLQAGFSHYELQGRLYTLALAKMLGLRSKGDYDARFGGFAFLFLRGMKVDGEPNAGVVFRRPDWDEVRAWEEELLRRDDLRPRGVA